MISVKPENENNNKKTKNSKKKKKKINQKTGVMKSGC